VEEVTQLGTAPLTKSFRRTVLMGRAGKTSPEEFPQLKPLTPNL
jgi:hypothetical protein